MNYSSSCFPLCSGGANRSDSLMKKRFTSSQTNDHIYAAIPAKKYGHAAPSFPAASWFKNFSTATAKNRYANPLGQFILGGSLFPDCLTLALPA